MDSGFPRMMEFMGPGMCRGQRIASAGAILPSFACQCIHLCVNFCIYDPDLCVINQCFFNMVQ